MTRFAYCERCGRTTVWTPHPAGWKCEGCRVCAERVQTALGEFGGESS